MQTKPDENLNLFIYQMFNQCNIKIKIEFGKKTERI